MTASSIQLINLSQQYVDLITTEDPGDLCLRQTRGSLTIESPKKGLLSRLYRWWHGDEYDPALLAQKVSKLFADTLKDIYNIDALKDIYSNRGLIKPADLSNIYALSDWLDSWILKCKIQKLQDKILKEKPEFSPIIVGYKVEVRKAREDALKTFRDLVSGIEESEIFATHETYRKIQDSIAELKRSIEEFPEGKLSSFFCENLMCMTQFIKKLSDLEVQIDEEKKKFQTKECGKVTVFLKETGNPCDLNIRRRTEKYPNRYRFDLYSSDGSPVGNITFNLALYDGVCFWPQKPKSQSLRSLPMTRVVYVDTMFSTQKEKYKGVGTKLLQLAMEQGWAQGCEGALALSASWSSHAFHYLQGLRASDAEKNKKIAEIVRQNQSTGKIQDTSELMGVGMHLTHKAINEWKKRIRENPLLATTKEECVMRLLST